MTEFICDKICILKCKINNKTYVLTVYISLCLIHYYLTAARSAPLRRAPRAPQDTPNIDTPYYIQALIYTDYLIISPKKETPYKIHRYSRFPLYTPYNRQLL